MDNFNKDDIIDVDFIEKDSTVLPNENQLSTVYRDDNDNHNGYTNEQTYYSNVKVVKLNPIIAGLIFIVLIVLAFMFIGVIAVVVLSIVAVSIIANYVIKFINKIKK